MIFAHGRSSGGGGLAVPIGAEVCIYFAWGLKRFWHSSSHHYYLHYYDSLCTATSTTTVITGLVSLICTFCPTLSENPAVNEYTL